MHVQRAEVAARAALCQERRAQAGALHRCPEGAEGEVDAREGLHADPVRIGGDLEDDVAQGRRAEREPVDERNRQAR